MGRRTVLAAIALLFLVSRLTHLTLLPVFIDESMYLVRAASLTKLTLMRSLQEGKLLHLLLTSVVVPRAADPLWAARALAVAAGACGLAAAWGLGRRLFDEATGVMAAALYVVCPFTLFYDRLNLADVYVASAAALALVVTLGAMERPSGRAAALLASALVAAIAAKATGLLALAFPLAALALARPRPAGAIRCVATGLGVCLAALSWPLLYFFSHTTQIESKAPSAGQSIQLFAENAGLAAGWLVAYWTAPLLAVGLWAGAAGLARRGRSEALLLLCASLPTLAFLVAANAWFPRYILLTTIPFLVLVASGLTRGWRWWTARAGGAARWAPAALALTLLLAPALSFDLQLLTDPARAPLPAVESFQFVNGWPSGYGWVDAVRLFQAERARHPEGLTVVNDETGHTTGRWAVESAFANDSAVEVETLALEDAGVQIWLDRRARQRPVYLLVTRRESPPPATLRFKPRRVTALHKPNRKPAGVVFRLEPRPKADLSEPSAP